MNQSAKKSPCGTRGGMHFILDDHPFEARHQHCDKGLECKMDESW